MRCSGLADWRIGSSSSCVLVGVAGGIVTNTMIFSGPLVGVRKRGVTRFPVRYGTGPGWSWSAGTGSSAGLDRRGSEARSEAGSLEHPSLSRNLRLAMHSTKSILVTGAYNLRP